MCDRFVSLFLLVWFMQLRRNRPDESPLVVHCKALFDACFRKAVVITVKMWLTAFCLLVLKAACFLGVDIDDGQLQKADENVAFAGLQSRLHLLRASSKALPLPSASVDAVVCDLPFGRKFSTRENMAENLPHILSEMERVLRVGGTLVLLLTPQLSCHMKKLLPQQHFEAPCNGEPQAGRKNCPVSSSEQQNSQVKPSSSQETLSFSSLRHQTTYRVSLGTIDGLIHKYIKMFD